MPYQKIRVVLLIALFFSCTKLKAHEGGHSSSLKEWLVNTSREPIKAEFVKFEEDHVWLSNEFHLITEHNLSDFSIQDQKYILDRHKLIQSLNTETGVSKSSYWNSPKWPLLFGGILLLVSIFLFFKNKTSYKLTLGLAGVMVLFFISCNDEDHVPGATKSNTPSNKLSFLESVFGSFSEVTTSSDDEYFYVASNGLPNHDMMEGITNWQQQVPITHEYTGSNSWSIPLNPQLSGSPLSTKTNLLKGAIAIAANGIPIFNPLNNRGEDANDIGELDQWGGHCGKADDYHYHLPPTHLQTTVGAGKPIAYAVDGFPVYGETTEELDEYLGKLNDDGSYQYHTVKEYPYFIASMRGVVTLDPNTTAPENQVIPQATTRGVRPSTEPLKGASITKFESTGSNAYSLTYTLNSEEYIINYSWDASGKYTYEFVNPTGTTTETYQR